MIRSYNYDSLQSIEDSTFLPFIGRKLSDQEVIDMFRGSSFYDESMTYQVKFNYQAASKWQPFFVIKESTQKDDHNYITRYFYGIGGYMWMTPSVYSLVRSRVQESLSVLTQSNDVADTCESGLPNEGFVFRLMNYRHDFEELEKKIQKLSDEALFNEKDEVDSDDDDDDSESDSDSNSGSDSDVSSGSVSSSVSGSSNSSSNNSDESDSNDDESDEK